VFQSVFIALWIFLNSLKQFDGKQLQLLTLLLSLQAAYAAPLILLAQNRQEQRDRVQTELDRRVAERTQVDTEFLARELAGVRLGLSDVATSSELGDQLERITRALERLADRLTAMETLVDKADAE
jgi:uncharacterized membrane protein